MNPLPQQVKDLINKPGVDAVNQSFLNGVKSRLSKFLPRIARTCRPTELAASHRANLWCPQKDRIATAASRTTSRVRKSVWMFRPRSCSIADARVWLSI